MLLYQDCFFASDGLYGIETRCREGRRQVCDTLLFLPSPELCVWRANCILHRSIARDRKERGRSLTWSVSLSRYLEHQSHHHRYMQMWRERSQGCGVLCDCLMTTDYGCISYHKIDILWFFCLLGSTSISEFDVFLFSARRTSCRNRRIRWQCRWAIFSCIQ